MDELCASLTIYSITTREVYNVPLGELRHLPSVGDKFHLSNDYGQPIVSGIVMSIEYSYDYNMGEGYFIKVDESEVTVAEIPRSIIDRVAEV